MKISVSPQGLALIDGQNFAGFWSAKNPPRGTNPSKRKQEIDKVAKKTTKNIKLPENIKIICRLFQSLLKTVLLEYIFQICAPFRHVRCSGGQLYHRYKIVLKYFL